MSRMLQIGFLIMQISGWSLLFQACLYKDFNLYFTFGLLGLFQFGALIVLPNLFSKAFSSVGHMAGYAGAVYSLIQIGGAATWGELASLMPADTLIPLAVMMNHSDKVDHAAAIDFQSFVIDIGSQYSSNIVKKFIQLSQT